MNFPFFFRMILLSILFSALENTVFGLEYIEFSENGQNKKEEGRVVLEAQDGLVFEVRDGRYFILSPDSVRSRRSDDKPFVPYTKKEIVERLKKEFPESQGFNILESDPFIIVYTTSRGFAQWYANLLKKFYGGFRNFWRQEGIELEEPQYPMVAVVLSSQDALARYALRENFQLMQGQIAYYNKATNRVAICDLSGLEVHRQGDQGRATTRDIQAFLNQPRAADNIATVIHEATHLVGFSCGLHPRFAPNPLWLCEGLAVFHEVPDRGKRAGWSITPKSSPSRLARLNAYFRQNPIAPMETIIRGDEPFNRAETAAESYAMAWGLTYYLVKRRPKEFKAYLEKMMLKDVETEDSPEIRIREFEECFGDDWPKLYKELREYLKLPPINR